MVAAGEVTIRSVRRRSEGLDVRQVPDWLVFGAR
jgi:hypothetical protein